MNVTWANGRVSPQHVFLDERGVPRVGKFGTFPIPTGSKTHLKAAFEMVRYAVARALAPLQSRQARR